MGRLGLEWDEKAVDKYAFQRDEISPALIGATEGIVGCNIT
jgi:hypothetical protein